MSWLPMTTAPQDGSPFLYLRRITRVGGGLPPRYEYTIEPLLRHKSSEDSPGVWYNAVMSVPDHEIDMSRGWWCHSLPLNLDGTVKLPPDFVTAPPVHAEKTPA